MKLGTDLPRDNMHVHTKSHNFDFINYSDNNYAPFWTYKIRKIKFDAD